jgi:uncharacterized protein YbdZ (MbtH family)
MSIIPALWRIRKEDKEFKASLCYIERQWREREEK